LGRAKRTIKEEEEQGKNYCKKKTCGASFGAKRSSMGLFFCNKGVHVKKNLENNMLSFFQC
jgi:hypothetical protein